MGSFTSRLAVTDIQDDDGLKWLLLEPFEFYERAIDGPGFVIKSGFITDFASVPRLLWPIFPPFSPEYGKAAVLHDGLYSSKIVTRKRADDLFCRE